MSSFVSVDKNKVVFNIKNVKDGLKSGITKRVLAVGYELLRLSQREVPHDEGTLQNSGTVEEYRGNVVVGYHTPYAARLHEHPEYNFQKGRKGKYLEDPIRHNESALGLEFADGVKKVIGESIK